MIKHLLGAPPGKALYSELCHTSTHVIKTQEDLFWWQGPVSFLGRRMPEEQEHRSCTPLGLGKDLGTLDSRRIIKVKRANHQDGTAVRAATKATQRDMFSSAPCQNEMKLLDTQPKPHSPRHNTPPGWAQRQVQDCSREISRAASAKSAGCVRQRPCSDGHCFQLELSVHGTHPATLAPGSQQPPMVRQPVAVVWNQMRCLRELASLPLSLMFTAVWPRHW